jgi:hypothetical protein
VAAVGAAVLALGGGLAVAIAGIVAKSVAPAGLAPLAPAHAEVTEDQLAKVPMLFDETFGNEKAGQTLSSYTSSTGTKYTADPYWLNMQMCNGWLYSFDSPYPNKLSPKFCQGMTSSYQQLRKLQKALASLTPGEPAATNRVYSTHSDGGDPPSGDTIEFQTTSQVPVASASRYLAFGVDVAAMNCTVSGAKPPVLQFFLREPNGTNVKAGGELNVCQSSHTMAIAGVGNSVDDYGNTVPDYAGNDVIWYQRMVTGTSIKFDGTSFGVVLHNMTDSGYGNDHTIDDIRVYDTTPTFTTEISPATQRQGQVSTITYTVKNSAELAAKAGWGFTNTLPNGLVVASNPNIRTTCGASGSQTAQANGITAQARTNKIQVSNGQLTDQQASCTISVDVTTQATGDVAQTFNVCTAAFSGYQYLSPLSAQAQAGAQAGGCSKVSFVPGTTLQISETDTATANTRQGDQITYTLTAKNTSANNYTVAGPAQVRFDFGQAATTTSFTEGTQRYTTDKGSKGSLSHTGSVLQWAGPLKTGETLTVTGQLKVDSPLPVGTAAHLGGVYYQGQTKPATCPVASSATGSWPAASQEQIYTNPCLTLHTIGIPYSTIQKSAPTGQITDGAPVTFTVTVKNTSPTAYSAAAPASMTDDLSDVLDDATWQSVTAQPGSAQLSGTSLTWSGALGAGATATITYQVVFHEGAGDGALVNKACLKAGAQAPGAAQCASLQPDLAVTAGQTPARGIAVAPGGQVAYTLTFKNTGAESAYAAYRMPLGGITDDADVTAITSSDAAHLPAANVSGTLVVSGTVTPGKTVTVAVTATVKATAQAAGADRVVYGLVADKEKPAASAAARPACAAGEQLCFFNPVPSFRITKTVTPQSAHAAGDGVTYALRAINDGGVPLTAIQWADTGAYESTTAAGFSGTGQLTFTCDTVSITKPLAPGASQGCTASYPVTQDDVDSAAVLNTATAVATFFEDQTPGTADTRTAQIAAPVAGTASVTSTATVDLHLLSRTATPHFTDPLPQVGDRIDYTITVLNEGTKSARHVTLADSLAAAGDLTETWPTGDPEDAAGMLRPGETLTATFEHALTQADITAGQVAGGAGVTSCETAGCTVPAPVTSCPAAAGSTTTVCTVTPIPDLDIELVTQSGQTPIPDQSVVAAGDPVIYQMSVENISGADYTDALPAIAFADLSGLVDDATVQTASLHASTGTAALIGNGQILSWHGPIPSGHAAQIQFTAVYKTGGDTTARVTSYIPSAAATWDDPPATPSCPVGAPAHPLVACVTHLMADLAYQKTSDPPSGAVITRGESITYTIALTNRGAGAAALDLRDQMNDILDDADVQDAPVSDNPAVTVQMDPGSEELDIGGTLAAGAKAKVTYRLALPVEPKKGGNGALENWLLKSGEQPHPTCEPSSDTCATNPIPALSLDLEPDPPKATYQGEVVDFMFTATNSGQVPFTGIQLNYLGPFTDQDTPGFSGAGDAPTLICGLVSKAHPLQPGHQLTCGATYTVTQADIDAGHIELTATAAGAYDPHTGGTAGSDAASITSEAVSVDVPADASTELVVTLSQTPDLSEPRPLPGDPISYQATVRNVGEVTARDVRIESSLDGKPGMGALRISWPDQAGRLAPGDAASVTGTYLLQGVDLGAGQVVFGLGAGSCEGDGCDAAAPATTCPAATPSTACATSFLPAIEVTASAEPGLAVTPGQRITYSYTVQNTGGAPLTGLAIDDDGAYQGQAAPGFTGKGTMSDLTCDSVVTQANPLEPGETVRCQAFYTVTAQDIKAGHIDGTATASVTYIPEPQESQWTPVRSVARTPAWATGSGPAGLLGAGSGTPPGQRPGSGLGDIDDILGGSVAAPPAGSCDPGPGGLGNLCTALSLPVTTQVAVRPGYQGSDGGAGGGEDGGGGAAGSGPGSGSGAATVPGGAGGTATRTAGAPAPGAAGDRPGSGSAQAQAAAEAERAALVETFVVSVVILGLTAWALAIALELRRRKRTGHW